MENSFLSYIMRLFTSRAFFLILNAIVVFFSVDGIYYFINEGLSGTDSFGPDGHLYINATFGGIAIILMALGVLMGLREDMMKMGGMSTCGRHEYLNDVAKNFGIGLLLCGLLMEIITILILLPNAVINTSGVEITLYSFAVFIDCISIIIGINFMRKYLISYFNKVM